MLHSSHVELFLDRRPFVFLYAFQFLFFSSCCTFFMFPLFCVALFLHFFHVAFLHVTLFPRCTLFLFCHFQFALFCVALLSCCTFFILDSFTEHSFHVDLLCCTFVMLLFFVLQDFNATFCVLHSFHVALSSCCTLFMLQCHK